MNYKCDMCGSIFNINETNKLLNKRYCKVCLPKAKSKRRRAIKLSKGLKVETILDGKIKKRIKEYEKMPLESIVNDIKLNGLTPILSNNFPIRLKRNEKIYFLAGRSLNHALSIALAITNFRLFHVKTEYLLRTYLQPKNNMNITRGIKAFNLSSIIAIDKPRKSYDYKQFELLIHLNKGKGFSVIFSSVKGARLFYAILTELVDRINDPIDNSVFLPKRERIPEEVKIAVWRRDNGVCSHCGSRINLEYDHMIPISKGGSNTVRNIELLCEKCNRKKSNKIY